MTTLMIRKFTTSINEAGIFYGIALLPAGRRRAALESGARTLSGRLFAGCVLPFESEAAARNAAVVALRRQSGTPVDTLDAMIAAIAPTHNAGVATRDTGGLPGVGLSSVTNPRVATRQ